MDTNKNLNLNLNLKDSHESALEETSLQSPITVEAVFGRFRHRCVRNKHKNQQNYGNTLRNSCKKRFEMQASRSSFNGGVPLRRSPTPPMDSSSEDFDDLCLDNDLDDLDNISDVPKKPHFLDYDSVPPPELEENCPSSTSYLSTATTIECKNSRTTYSMSEHVKIDKKYERDGEISDYELSASDAMKMHRKEKNEMVSEEVPIYGTQQQQQRQISSSDSNPSIHTGTRRKKYLQECALPNNHDRDRDREREHRSLDRENTGRLNEFEHLKYERKHSLDRERIKRSKEPNYMMSSFMERDSSPVYRGTWPVDRPSDVHSLLNASSLPPGAMSDLGPKVECVYSLLSMLGSHDAIEMSSKFLELSRTPETCATLRRSGCIPLLVQMMYSDSSESARKNAGMALHNVVHCHPDDKAGRREAKVLRLIEQIMEYCNFLKSMLKAGESIADDTDRHPSQPICSLMKISFDEEHRHAMCQLGALQAIANLVHYDHAAHGPKSLDQRCISLRRYAGMALTNLTFGDGNNKALLCSNKNFMKALVAQLDSTADDLLQVTASVLRNLSWRADSNMIAVLNEIGTVTALTKAAMRNKIENTLKAILSALWNLSAHCSTNKAEFCSVDGALAFLVDMLSFDAPSKTLTIVENAGGILRNVSSHIAVREDYRKILRQRDCLGILLQQLKSESLTVVSNACGTLWNLSARCPEDQKYLWDNGAVPMLRSLIHSKHKMISNGSNAALKNLLNFRPGSVNQISVDSITKSMNLKELPTLNVRKQRALEQELDQNLSETCENLDVTTPPKEEKTVQDFANLELVHQNQQREFEYVQRLSRSAGVTKSESKESMNSTKSETAPNKRGSSAPPIIELPNQTSQTESEHESITSPDEPICFEIETENEQPINYGAKYNNEAGTSKTNVARKPEPAPRRHVAPNKEEKKETQSFGDYQETDLDQITDYSLRYAENQSDMEEKATTNAGSYSNEIILILEDTVKCYQTEGTPYAISNATSMSDLRGNKEQERRREDPKSNTGTVFSSGIHTPEKPVNYCEEGTPGYFSREFSHHGSLSSLDESPPPASSSSIKTAETSKNIKLENSSPSVLLPQTSTVPTTPGGTGSVPKAVTFVDFAQETPLMFSRNSSLESLSSAEPGCVDDRSSVVSVYSRVASGIISPSELPDSPTQSVPQSPRRPMTVGETSASVSNTVSAAPRLRSVFEDDVNTFGVENTPAQFSCATSLSNLSLDDEPKIATDCLTKEMRLLNHPSEEQEDDLRNQNQANITNTSAENPQNDNVVSDGEESANDDILLATCINIGMNRGVKNIEMPTNAQTTPGEATKATSSNKQILNPNDDAIKQYCTEDTPALLSKAGSHSDLSILSLDTNRCEAIPSDDSSNTSDAGNDNLLQQCIRDGMQKSSAKSTNSVSNNPSLPLIKENPIGMLRSGSLLPPYLSVGDETNKFTVEDSPCNFSVISGLSDITVGSEMAGLAKIKRPSVRDQAVSSEKSNVNIPFTQPSGDDSLSSISIDSEDDSNLLNQAIAAGSNPRPKSQTPSAPSTDSSNIHEKFKTTQFTVQTAMINNMPLNRNIIEPNDSYSSIDSCESNDNHSMLLEQCIRTGMGQDVNKNSTNVRPKTVTSTSAAVNAIVSPKRSQLPTLKSPSRLERDRHKEREKKDEQLLRECITTGMSKVGGTTNAAPLRLETQIKPPTRHTRQVLAPTDYNQRMTNLTINDNQIPKNGETTSAAVPDIAGAPSTAPDVENGFQDGTRELKRDRAQLRKLTEIINNKNGSDSDLLKSGDSLNMSSGSPDNILERSNEYPALKLSHVEFTDESINESNFDMEASNEFLMDSQESIDNSHSCKIDKHKDPDLMLKSVERLTQVLVSTAEYLRSSNQNDDTTYYEKKSSSNSNNTWNEDTYPNDISFPSISMTAPMIGSMNEDDTTFSDMMNPAKSWQNEEEPTPTNEMKEFGEKCGGNKLSVKIQLNANGVSNFLSNAALEDTLRFDTEYDEEDGFVSQPDSLETETDTVVNNSASQESSSSSAINFQVGGQVQTPLKIETLPHFLSSGPMSFDNSSTMSNSTIIAMEANKIVNELKKYNVMTESATSLDLDNIRPPSGMDSISLSGYFEMPQSPQLSIRSKKKTLPPGLFARRALGGHTATNGSLESINSNLDNVAPPSGMDDLLDSMISVASITSEIADNHISQLEGTSNYETALSDLDDTITLQSCLDLPTDSTPIPSDFSSAESTPKKIRNVKKLMTPKQKRQMIKDRYRTYTIAADMVIKEKADEIRNGIDDTAFRNNYETEEVLSIEIDESVKRITPRQRRQEDRSRFQTQVLDPSAIINRDFTTDETNRFYRRQRSDDPDRYRTHTISSNEDETLQNVLAEANIVLDALNKHKASSEEFLLDETSDTMSLVSNDDNDDMSSIRALTAKFKHLNNINVVKITSMTTRTTTTISQNRFFEDEVHKTESDLNSIEYEQNSGTESCDQNNYSDSNEEILPIIRSKPRIVKPDSRDLSADSNCSEDGESPENKAIRGRRKAAYVSPYRRSIVGSSKSSSPKQPASPKNSPVVSKQTVTPPPGRTNLATKLVSDSKKAIKTPQASKLIPRNQTMVTKTHVFINKANLTNKINTAPSGLVRPGFSNVSKNVLEKNLINKTKSPSVKTETTKVVSKLTETKTKISGKVLPDTPTTSKNLTPPKMPERQGTFTKDEPSNANVPIVTSEPSTPIKTSKLPSKIATPKSPAKTGGNFLSKWKNPLQKSASVDTSAGKGLPCVKSATRPLSTASAVTDPQKRRSLGVYKSPSVPSVPLSQRSNSNASIKSNVKKELPHTTPPSRSNSNVTAPKRDIGSRIAGLWKKQGDDTKKSSPSLSKPTIAKSSAKVPGENLAGKPPVASKLIRSSTFESTPTVTKITPPTAMERLAQISAGIRQQSQETTGQNSTVGLRYIKSPSSGTLKSFSEDIKQKPDGDFLTPTTTAVTDGVVVMRRTKGTTNGHGPDEDGETAKRISRLGSFINVDGDCQVAG